jgi:hypothetical protein
MYEAFEAQGVSKEKVEGCNERLPFLRYVGRLAIISSQVLPRHRGRFPYTLKINKTDLIEVCLLYKNYQA